MAEQKCKKQGWGWSYGLNSWYCSLHEKKAQWNVPPQELKERSPRFPCAHGRSNSNSPLTPLLYQLKTLHPFIQRQLISCYFHCLFIFSIAFFSLFFFCTPPVELAAVNAYELISSSCNDGILVDAYCPTPQTLAEGNLFFPLCNLVLTPLPIIGCLL